MMHSRWPLHPQPLEAECLSSWLRRIAMAYSVSLADLVEHGLRFPRHHANWLDRIPPINLLEAVSLHTGLPLEQVRRTTFVDVISFLIGYTPCNENSVLIEPSRYRRGRFRSRSWLRQESSDLACRLCLTDYPDAGILLPWRLSITHSCPFHGTMLEPGLIENDSVRWLNDTTRQAPRLICALDFRNYEALSEGNVELPGGEVDAAHWFCLLQEILDELTRPGSSFLGTGSPVYSVHAAAAKNMRHEDISIGRSLLIATAIDMMERGVVFPQGAKANLFMWSNFP